MKNFIARLGCFMDVIIGKAKKHVVYTYVNGEDLSSVSFEDDNVSTAHLAALLHHATILLKDHGVDLE